VLVWLADLLAVWLGWLKAYLVAGLGLALRLALGLVKSRLI